MPDTVAVPLACLSVNEAGIRPRLAEDGLVLVDGLAGPADLLDLARELMTITPHRDSDPSGLTTIANIGGPARTGFAGFTARALNPHTDRSGVAHPPAMLLTSCGQAATNGGECVFIDGKTVYDDLVAHHPDAARALRAPRSALFGGTGGYLGSVFNHTNGRLTIRLRLDELARFSPEVSHWLPVLHAAIDQHTIAFKLGPGQGYLLDNHRWLHGRHAFTGHRVMYRVTGNPLPHLDITPGFTPTHHDLTNQHDRAAESEGH